MSEDIKDIDLNTEGKEKQEEGEENGGIRSIQHLDGMYQKWLTGAIIRWPISSVIP